MDHLNHPTESAGKSPIAEPALTAELLADLKVQYGMVGTRDVDVAAWNAKLDRAIAALTHRSGVPTADEESQTWANVVHRLLPLMGKDCDVLDDLEEFLRRRASSGHPAQAVTSAAQRPGDAEYAAGGIFVVSVNGRHLEQVRAFVDALERAETQRSSPTAGSDETKPGAPLGSEPDLTEQIATYIERCGGDTGHFVSTEAAEDFANLLRDTFVASPLAGEKE